MDAQQIIELLVSLRWFLFALVVFCLFYRQIRDELLPNLASFKAGGVELSFVKQSMEGAIRLAEKSSQWNVKVPSEAKEQVLKRAKRQRHILAGAQIFWVDDHPENNVNERRMFRHLHIDIDTAKATQDALPRIQPGRYDLIISDIARDEGTDGLDFLTQLRNQDKTTPVIFYIGNIEPNKGVPAKAFGLTNRPDELLHLVLDALERKRS